MLTHHPDVLVRVRHPRWSLVPVILLVAVFETGLLLALGQAVTGGGWSSDGEPLPLAASIAAWILVPLFSVLLGIALVVSVASLRQGTQVEEIGARGLVGTIAGRESLRIDLADVRRITYLPALRATWQRSGKSADRRLRWTANGVGYDRIVVEGAGSARCEFGSAQRQWPDIVNALRVWTQARPDLCADDETAEFLATPYPPRRSLGPRLIGPAVCVALGVAGLAWLVARWDGGLGASIWPGVLGGGLGVGLIAWFGLLLPAFLAIRGISRVVRARDPWLPFEPDAHGRYAWVLNGRSGTFARAPQRRTTWGLVWRWGYLGLYAALPVILVVEGTRIVLA